MWLKIKFPITDILKFTKVIVELVQLKKFVYSFLKFV